MKQILIFSTLILALAVSSCKDDDPGFQFDPAVMHYDGVNATAPVLPAGEVELAAQFKSDAMDFYAGKKIDAIQFFIFEVPAAASLVIYGKGNGSNPGAVLYEQDITGDLEPNDWNVIPLDSLFSLPSDEIWISFNMPESGGVQVLGCDAGPTISGGDWMWENSDKEWKTFFERNTVDKINWNIRASMTD
jgi:hypothetical protein